MKVKELIAELVKCNPEAIVIYKNMEIFEVDNVGGIGSDDLELDLLNEPPVPLAQAKSIVIY